MLLVDGQGSNHLLALLMMVGSRDFVVVPLVTVIVYLKLSPGVFLSFHLNCLPLFLTSGSENSVPELAIAMPFDGKVQPGVLIFQ